MKQIQACLALTAALLALPAVAADRSETISLNYASAAELEQFLTQPPLKRPETVGHVLDAGVKIGGGTLLPKGIAAWGVDVSRNTLSVTGSDDAIEQLKRIIRVLDVPPRRIELSLQLYPMEAAEAAMLRKDPAALDSEGITVIPLLTPNSRKRFEERAPSLAAKLSVSNFRTVTVRIPGKNGGADEMLGFTPQLNGDGSISVTASGLYAGDKRDSLLTARRLHAGTSVVLLDGENRAWLVFPKVLPDAAPEQK